MIMSIRMTEKQAERMANGLIEGGFAIKLNDMELNYEDHISVLMAAFNSSNPGKEVAKYYDKIIG